MSGFFKIANISMGQREEEEKATDVEKASVGEFLKATAANTRDLFKGSLVKLTLLMLFINFAIQFGYVDLPVT